VAKHPALRKAVKRLQYVYVNTAAFYSEDGQSVRVDIQDKHNGVLQEPFALAIEVDDAKPAGLRIRRSGVEWTEQEELTPGILIPSDKEFKARRKAERANAPHLSDKFTVLGNPNADWDQQFSFEEAKQYPECRVWTVVSGDSGKLWAIAGFHIVNKLHYAITEQPWTEEDESIDYKW
jgi:hypothetical protein